MSRALSILQRLWEQHEYATIQLTFPTEVAKQVRSVRGQIPPGHIDTDEDKDLDPHVTVFYGLQDEDFKTLEKRLQSFGPITYTIPGHLDLFKASKYKVLHFPVESESLTRLHEEVKKITGKEPPTFKDYKPHATVAYLKGNSPTKFDVPFRNLSGRTDSVDFCTISGESIPIKLR